MFTIRKNHKFQILFFHNPSRKELIQRIETENIETRTSTEHLRKVFSTRGENIMGAVQIGAELDKFGIVILKDFFLRFPSAWEELKRKINKHKSYIAGRWFIVNEQEEEILSVFLRLGRQDGIGPGIENAFRTEIFGNGDLIEQVGKEPSILDSSHGSLGFLRRNQRLNFIEHIIRTGIKGNIDNGNQGLDKEIIGLLPEMIKYLKSIFAIEFGERIKAIRSVRSLAEFIVNEIWADSAQGVEAKNAWMLAKAFTTWGGFKSIEQVRKNALTYSETFPDTLRRYGMDLGDISQKVENLPGGEHIHIHSGTIDLHLKSGTVRCKIEYRIKSMRSIFLKLWENEDYNNIDAMKDIFGVAIIIPEGTSSEVKQQIIGEFSQLMANKGYLVKNKGLLDTKEVKSLKRSLNEKEKKPLGKIVHKKRGKTAKEFQNTSISGFTTIFDDPIGMEIQFHEQESYDFWKNDHYLFDPLKVTSGWSRGSWFITPHQMLQVIRNEIHPDIREAVIRKLPQQILMDYIRRGKIIAYQGENKDVYLTTEDHKEKFISKFRIAKEIDITDTEFIAFIESLNTSNVSSTIFKTSSQTRDQGRGHKARASMRNSQVSKISIRLPDAHE